MVLKRPYFSETLDVLKDCMKGIEGNWKEDIKNKTMSASTREFLDAMMSLYYEHDSMVRIRI